ncbi:MAG TPA: DUF885 domain-containing protein [Candidatus Limnocylindrales bacterium]|nr:DUF885 domain-containing protein [Candidatus Limnocylindrales bacterium]
MDAATELRRAADAYWDDLLRDSPVLATILGDRRFDDRLDDRSPEGVARSEAMLRGHLDAARAIDEAGLSTADRVTRQTLVDVIEGQLAALGTRIYEWNVDPMNGPQTTFLDLPDFQTVTTPEEGRDLVARWRAMGRYFDQAIADLRESMAEGRVAVREPVVRTIDELHGLATLAPADWKLAAPARLPLDDWSARDRDAFRSAVLGAVTEVAIPAFWRYRDALEGHVMPAARSNDQPGLCHIPGGGAAYRAMIRDHTSLDLDPEAVHRTGLDEIARIDAAFVELGARLLQTPDLATTLASLRTDPKLRFTTAEEVFDTAQRSLDRATAAIPDWFGRLPQAPCEVVPVPEHAQAHQTIAYYFAPAFDGSRPGRYYINLYQPDTRPRYEAECLAFHESVPGHHLQLAIAQEIEGIPAFQRNLGSTAFIEGWGLYSERLSNEMGLYSDELDQFGVLSYDAWRAGRLVVDTGIHAFGWTRRQAIGFLHDHSALADNNIANEVDRYICMPAQALAYKTGQLEILRLREDARRRLGDRFDIKGFHDTVLGSGAVSLPTLGNLVAAWVEELAREVARPG